MRAIAASSFHHGNRRPSTNRWCSSATVTALACLHFGLDRQTVMIVVLFQVLPTASSSCVTARQRGGDGDLMAGIVAFQTVPAIVVVRALLLKA